MSNDKIYSAPMASQTKLKKYDEICGAMFVNLYTRSKNEETIDLANFNPKNQEHLFVLGVARGLAGAYGKKVRVDVSRWQLWKLNFGLDKDCRTLRFNSKEGIVIDTQGILDFMRKQAVDSTGDNLIFCAIYNEFYAKKGKKQ